MAGNFGFKMTGLFFDDKEVLRALDKATRNVLAEYGSRVRTTARQSMKPGKKGKPSNPGEAPHKVKGQLKKFLFFVYDPQTRSEVIGPQSFRPAAATQIPEVHEEGLTMRVGRGGRIRARYPKRPYMAPANEKRLPELQELWKDSIVR